MKDQTQKDVNEMKINGIPPSDMLYQYTKVRDKQSASFQSQIGADKVEITGDAKTFSAAMKKAREQMDASDVNQARVDTIKVQIENGTYYVPGFKVAGKILGE